MRMALLLSLTAALTVTAADDKDLAKFQGKWELTSSERDGKKLPTGTLRTVKGEKYTMTTKGGKEVGKGTIKLGGTGKVRDIDIARDGEKALLGIYSFDGDEQKVCIAPAGKPRPTAFTSKDGHLLSVWKKVK